MLTSLLVSLACLIGTAVAAPALALEPQLIQPGLPYFIQQPILLRQSPAILERPLRQLYPLPLYQQNPYLIPANYVLLRQNPGGDQIVQVQQYLENIQSQISNYQNQTNDFVSQIQTNLENNFNSGFEIVSSGFESGFGQIGGLAGGLRAHSAPPEQAKIEKLESEKNKENLLLQPLGYTFYENRLLPLGLVRYGYFPSLGQPQQLELNKEAQTAQQQAQGRSNDEIKADKEKEPVQEASKSA